MADERGSVLQFEIDRKRLDLSTFVGMTDDSHDRRIRNIGNTALKDTLKHGGTFVLVVTETKITMVQRPEAEEI